MASYTVGIGLPSISAPPLAARIASSEKVPGGPRNATRIGAGETVISLLEGDGVARPVVVGDLLARDGLHDHLEGQLLALVRGGLDRDRRRLDRPRGDLGDRRRAADRLCSASELKADADVALFGAALVLHLDVQRGRPSPADRRR